LEARGQHLHMLPMGQPACYMGLQPGLPLIPTSSSKAAVHCHPTCALDVRLNQAAQLRLARPRLHALHSHDLRVHQAGEVAWGRGGARAGKSIVLPPHTAGDK
jgi:hypothetical protein